MAPPNSDAPPRSNTSEPGEAYAPPAVPFRLPAFEIFSQKSPAAEKEDPRFAPASAFNASPETLDIFRSAGVKPVGGLEGARQETFFTAPGGLNSNPFIGKDKERGDRITEINFACGKKSALIGYANDSATTPNRIDITEKAPDSMVSRTSYRQEESGKWGLYINDRRLTQLPGEVKLAKDGTISHETGDGYWHTERLDGSAVTEKQLSGGALVAVGNDGIVSQVSRPDGSRVEVERIAGQMAKVTETDAQGQKVVWNNTDGSWTSAQRPGEVRKDIKLFNNGLLSYNSGDTRTHVLGNGNELKESASAHNIKFDEQGRLQAVSYPNGDTRSVVFEEGSDKIKSMTYTVGKTGQKYEYNRIGSADKFEYKLTEANGQSKSGKWNGAIEFSPDGTFTTRDGDGNNRQADGFSTRVPIDGKTYLEKKNADGSILICDPKKNLQAVIRPDGSKVECQRNGEQISKVMETRPDGSKISFNYDAQTKSWSSGNAMIPISKTAPLDADGNLKFKTNDGSTHTVGTNGRERIVTNDGATLEHNSKGELERITQRNGDYRVINRDGDKLVGFTDYDKGGAVKRDVKAVSGIQLEDNGDMKFVDNGKIVVEKANFNRVENDVLGRIAKVVRPDGSHRDFTYDQATGELSKISDVTKTDKGERADDWTRKRAPDGRFTDTYERLRAQDNRAVESRTDVKLDPSGDYTYKDSKGRERESKVSERFRRSAEGFSSATVEEAHFNFLDEMRTNVNDESKLERLELMMNGFEKRLTDAIELRVAAGASEEEAREKVEAKIATTYDHLTRLVQSDSAAIDDKATRVMLAETFMYHAWEPETVNQQGWGSCWLQSGYIPCGLGKHPDDMAKVLADVSLTGKYTDRKGNDYSFKQDQLGIHRRADGAGWSIQSATQDNSQPSPVAHRFDRTMSVMDRGARYGGAGDSGRIRYGGGGQNEIMRRVTGDQLLYIGAYPRGRQERQALLEAGGAQRSGGPGHVATLAMRKVDGAWAIVRGDQYDGRDRVVSVIRDLKQWLNNGESARIERSFAPAWNKEFKIADSVKPSDFRPGPNRPDRDPDDDVNRPSRPIVGFFRRFRRR